MIQCIFIAGHLFLANGESAINLSEVGALEVEVEVPAEVSKLGHSESPQGIARAKLGASGDWYQVGKTEATSVADFLTRCQSEAEQAVMQSAGFDQ